LLSFINNVWNGERWGKTNEIKVGENMDQKETNLKTNKTIIRQK
jgi:hypothetical protein